MAPAALVVAAVAIVAASAVSAAGAIQQGKAAKEIGEYNAKLAEMEARAAKNAAAFEEQKLREQHDLLRGSQIAAAAAQGRDVSEGSPLLIRSETAADVELDALAIRYQGSVAAAQKYGEAAISRYQGRQAQIASRYQAGATILGGVGKAASLFAGGAGAPAGTSPAAGMSAGIPTSYQSTEI